MRRRRARARNPSLANSDLVCKPGLPSGSTAIDLMQGKHELYVDVARVVGSMICRGALVAGGLFIAGLRGKELIYYTVAATGAVEVGVLSWAAYQTLRDEK